jgi:hypothetical protein
MAVAFSYALLGGAVEVAVVVVASVVDGGGEVGAGERWNSSRNPLLEAVPSRAVCRLGLETTNLTSIPPSTVQLEGETKWWSLAWEQRVFSE